MKLCMIGTGYVGLVSGTCFADIGNQVYCVDKDKNKINKLNSGISPIYEPGLDELIKKNYNANRLIFTTDIKKAINSSDLIFICVGTPTKKGSLKVDLSFVYKCVKEILKYTKKKKIIKKKNDKRIIREFKKIKKYQRMIKFVYQNNPKGTGDAVLKCRKYIKGKFFLMLLPDDLIINKNCSKEMIRLHKRTKGSVIASKRVDKKTVSRWGILAFAKKRKYYFRINDVIEKPSIKQAPSNYAIIGRYILPSKIFSEITKLKPGQGKEIHITDAIKNLIYKGEKFFGNIFTGKYLDCGTIDSYIQSGIKIFKGLK